MERITAPRYINMYPHKADAGLGQSTIVYRGLDGLVQFADLAGGVVRGAYTTTTGACYAVSGFGLYRVQSDGTSTLIGSLATGAGPVEFGENTDQLACIDGLNLYIVTLTTDAFVQVIDPAFYGSKRMAVIDGYGLFVRPYSGEFYISDVNDFTSFDALDFASAEGSPDNATAILADHRQARVFGSQTTEGWFNSGDPDFPFARDPSSYAQVGTDAPYTPRLASNSVLWLGSSEEGNGVVYMSTGNSIERVSTHEVELAIQDSTDITASRAYVYQDDGHLFYCLRIPGLDTMHVYDVSTQEWHERAEAGPDGFYDPHRGTCHTFAFGYHLLGADDGKLYRLDRTAYTNAGDPLTRERIYPQDAQPTLDKAFYGLYEIKATAGDADAGEVPVVSMRYSNDGGNAWSEWRDRELGRTGEYKHRARWLGNGSAYDRVWHERCTSNAPFSIVTVRVQVNG